MAGFSSSVLLADLDYIAPSQVCILPTQRLRAARDEEAAVAAGDGAVAIHTSGDSVADAVSAAMPAQRRLDRVEITLADCLACNGCVTSAETILITNQSRGEVERLSARHRAVAGSDGTSDAEFLVTLAEQSVAAAAVEWRVSFDSALCRISGFCRTAWDATAVVPLGWAQTVSSIETGAEFVRRMDAAVSAATATAQLPLIVSACPGWVCYCEKTHPTLLPRMCPVMSAQAIAGKHFKSTAQSSTNTPSRIHVSVQPCFDKKLEAVRPEFQIGGDSSRSADIVVASHETTASMPGASDDATGAFTDCVLSTKELLDWMAECSDSGRVCVVDAPADSWECCVRRAPSSSDADCGAEAVFPVLAPTGEAASRAGSQAPVQTDGAPAAVNDATLASSSSSSSSSSAAAVAAAPYLGAVVSGGYHLAAMAALARSRGIEDFDLSRVQYVERRGNRNFRIATHPQLVATSNSSSTTTPARLLQFAVVYGFQHIQNVVRAFATSGSTASSATAAARARVAASKARRAAGNAAMSSDAAAAADAGSSASASTLLTATDAAAAAVLAPNEYCFIEMMACPGGCTNGGGQLLQLLEPEVHRVRNAGIDAAFIEHFWSLAGIAPSPTPGAAAARFAPDRVYDAATAAPGVASGFALVRTSFKDRRQSFEEKLNGGTLSLKW